LIRAVVDTNVLVAAIRRGTTTRRVAEAWLSGRARLIISREIIQEYLRVLSYPKLHLSAIEVKQVLEEVVLPYAEIVEPAFALPHLDIEEADRKSLVCAVSGKADYLITGDQQFLKIERFRFIRVVTPASFLNTLVTY